MNDLDLCLERSYQGHVNHCVTFDVEYLGYVRDKGLVPKEHDTSRQLAYGESNQMVT